MTVSEAEDKVNRTDVVNSRTKLEPGLDLIMLLSLISWDIFNTITLTGSNLMKSKWKNVRSYQMIFDISQIIYIYNIFTVFYSNILTLNLKKIYMLM